MPEFSDLSDGLLLEIAKQLDDGEMNALCNSNRQTYNSLNGHLYRRDVTRPQLDSKSLYWAVVHGEEDIIEQAVTIGQNLNPVPENYHVALLFAACDGKARMVELLLKVKGINPNWINPNNLSVVEDLDILGYATVLGHTAVVKLLLDHPNTDPNFVVRDGLSALMRTRKPDVIKVLLDKKDVDVNRQDDLGRTALCQAVRLSCLEAVRTLLDRDDIKVNIPDKDGRTALFWACKFDCLPVVDLLLKRDDIDPNAKDNNGYSPLAYVCLLPKANSVAIIRLLLSRKIDLNSVDQDGFSILAQVIRDVTPRHGEEIEGLLRAAGAEDIHEEMEI